MSASIIPLPCYYGPKRKPKRGRPPKNSPKATILQFPAKPAPADPGSMTSTERAKAAYSLYLQASKLDESSDPANINRAFEMYEKALQLDPYLAIAYTNLGNIHFRRFDSAKATSLYRKALELSPNQPEALYNLGYLELEGGHPMAAIPLFKRSLQADPDFADAHFNLAMALEQIGAPERSQVHWQRYVAIEPNGMWSDIARRHLG